MYPMLLKPAFKETIWGGTKLKTEYGKDCDFENLAESWEASCHPSGLSTVANGLYAGRSLAEVWKDVCKQTREFPLLVKLIDAHDTLSIQVHPKGKTEMWYVLDAEPDAEVILGLNRDVTRDELAEAIADGSLPELCHKIKARAGDIIFIPAGQLHAIGKGILLAEIQQSSDITYRVYDYGRLSNGKPRELHIEKALDVMSLAENKRGATRAFVLEDEDEYIVRDLLSCPFFHVKELELFDDADFFTENDGFHILLTLDGEMEISYENDDGDEEILPIAKGQTVFVPGGMDYVLHTDDVCKCLMIAEK